MYIYIYYIYIYVYIYICIYDIFAYVVMLCIYNIYILYIYIYNDIMLEYIKKNSNSVNLVRIPSI